MMPTGLAISIFSGAGGLDLGVEAAGYRVGAAVEVDGDAADTMERNLKSLVHPVIRRSLLDVPTRELVRAAGLRGRERPDLLVGGPPCTAFSKSGYWLDWKRAGRDPSAGLLQAYARVLAEARPRALLLENVSALTYRNRAAAPAFARLLRDIDAAGYRCRWAVLNAADYGVPQLRSRLFIVGSPKRSRLPDLPAPTHGAPVEQRMSNSTPVLPHVTAGEALAQLEPQPEAGETLRGRWAHLLSDIPPGDNYLFYTVKRGHPDPVFEWRARYWSFLLKLDPHRPSPTIQAHPGPNVGPFHWDNRRLRVPELKRLFSFPDHFEFLGRRSSVQTQIGNAAPPLLAQAVAEQLARAMP